MLRKNLFYNSLLSISQFIFPLVTFPYSSRVLGPAGIGSVNFIDSFTQYFILFAALGIPLYGVREISKCKHDPARVDQVFSEILLVHLISTLLFSLVYISLALCTPGLRAHMDMIAVGVAIIFFNVLSAEWLFQGLEQFAFITSRSLVVRTLSVILLFVFLKNNSPVTYYLIMASGIALNGLVNLFYLRKLVNVRMTNLRIIGHIKPLVIIFASTLAVSVYILMDNVILGFLQGEKEVGFYATALRIVRLPLALVSAVNGVIIPQVSRAYIKNDLAGITSLINKSFSLICIIGFPVTMGMYVSAAFLIQTFAGSQFKDSVPALQILAPLVLINAIGNIVCLQLLGPMGKERYLLRAYIISMVFSLIVNISLIRFYSYIGASIGMLITECLATWLCYYYLRKVFQPAIHTKVFWQCLGGALLFIPIAFLARMIPVRVVIKEMLVIGFCTAFYGAYMLFYVRNEYLLSARNMLLAKFHFGLQPTSDDSIKRQILDK